MKPPLITDTHPLIVEWSPLCNQKTQINSRSVSDGRTVLLLTWCDLWMGRPHEWLVFKLKPTQLASYSCGPSKCLNSLYQVPYFFHWWVSPTPWPTLSVWLSGPWGRHRGSLIALYFQEAKVHYINSCDPRCILPTCRNLFLYLLSWLRGQFTLSWVSEKVRGGFACTGLYCDENMMKPLTWSEKEEKRKKEIRVYLVGMKKSWDLDITIQGRLKASLTESLSIVFWRNGGDI